METVASPSPSCWSRIAVVLESRSKRDGTAMSPSPSWLSCSATEAAAPPPPRRRLGSARASFHDPRLVAPFQEGIERERWGMTGFQTLPGLTERPIRCGPGKMTRGTDPRGLGLVPGRLRPNRTRHQRAPHSLGFVSAFIFYLPCHATLRPSHVGRAVKFTSAMLMVDAAEKENACFIE